MSIQCTFAANHLPETKMRWYPTQVINVVVERGERKCIYTSRFQDETQARSIDRS